MNVTPFKIQILNLQINKILKVTMKETKNLQYIQGKTTGISVGLTETQRQKYNEL